MAAVRSSIGLGLVLVAGCGAERARAPVAVEIVARDLLEEDGALEVVRHHPEHAPRTAALCPSLQPARDGEDRLALVMPPPCEVRFSVADEGPALFAAAAGVGHEVQRQLGEERSSVEVRFEVLVNGEPRFQAVETVERVPRPEGYEWLAVRDAAGARFELARGDVVILRTSCLADGREVVPEAPLQVGFGEPRLVRTRDVVVPAATPERPNLILVVQDTQRRDRLVPYGYRRDTSPNLAALARRGTVFEQAYATSSWTWPSTASLLTGMLPAQHGVLSEAACHLARGLDVLPEVLARAGYRTAGFSGSRIVVPSLGFHQGFERFDSFRGEFRKSPGLVPRALRWMEEHRDERFLLYLHLVDTHAPHRPRPEDLAALGATPPEDWTDELFQEYTRRLARGEGRGEEGELDPSRVVPDAHRAWLDDLYDASVRTGDHWLGRLVAKVDELGLAESTLIAFTADHGEELLDHGKLEHGHTLYGELVRVPLVLAGPGVPAGARVATPVSNRHLATTLAARGGARLEGVPDPLDLGELAGAGGTGGPSDRRAGRPVLFSTEHGVWRDGPRRTQHGMRLGDWVLHWAPECDDGAPAERLFRVSEDPLEHADLARTEPDTARDLRARIARTLEALESARRHPARAADDSTRRTLSEIGYLDD